MNSTRFLQLGLLLILAGFLAAKTNHWGWATLCFAFGAASCFTASYLDEDVEDGDEDA